MPASFPPADSATLLAKALEVATTVADPEIPVLSIADLGILRDIKVAEDSSVEVSITPTYSGCPAMNMIGLELELALEKAGFSKVTVITVLSPAWTTDWMTEDGKRKLREYGIAPPSGRTSRGALFGADEVQCPRCGSKSTVRLAEFGSTSCKALWRCEACREPFDYFKCH
ncbi:phenylacetate-CoA oxygenase subunit PaaJ [Rhizobiaceae bacterium n13]|uniref:Phenylacetate-CoA oxygenase subunit PaaJ n=2 Tax=Ferirhizobium litorale TaxID=2927786 RepID=A0AAE3QEJ5_9HYPH|nr:1,2-phenylacetyl-CoA epoxidase subunit PaaD [Fererhizobium litorale]MDI7862789.1 phenylacetate-CoA oxygenase subunit PaaJ [Fererhizobium litorale]MDI7924347.1 phenylacetate-CoA oxygenase subunit PaaJ [Fererhizobium litorale]